MEALEEHVDLLMRQVGAEAVTSDLRGGRGSVAEQLFSRCVDFAKTAAKVAAYVPLLTMPPTPPLLHHATHSPLTYHATHSPLTTPCHPLPPYYTMPPTPPLLHHATHSPLTYHATHYHTHCTSHYCILCIYSCPGNYLAMSQSQLTGKVMKMCYSFWKLVSPPYNPPSHSHTLPPPPLSL